MNQQRTIVLFGHVSTMQSAYMQLDVLLRERKSPHVVVIQTEGLQQATAKSLKQNGAALWYCGPTLTPPDAGWSPIEADKYLLGATFEKVAPKVVVAFNDFMGKARAVA